MVIHDVSMESFAVASGHLPTTGLNGCVGFVIILDDGSDIFIEHRSGLLLPLRNDIEDIREYLREVVRSLTKLKPRSQIT